MWFRRVCGRRWVLNDGLRGPFSSRAQCSLSWWRVPSLNVDILQVHGWRCVDKTWSVCGWVLKICGVEEALWEQVLQAHCLMLPHKLIFFHVHWGSALPFWLCCCSCLKHADIYRCVLPASPNFHYTHPVAHFLRAKVQTHTHTLGIGTKQSISCNSWTTKLPYRFIKATDDSTVFFFSFFKVY